jgi:hypothetical protein
LWFEEWQPEEEGHPLPRVWIRIHRLSAKLREFSVLWALGSMLGATQSVDMVTSSRKNYGRVEVAVLNVDLLPNLIDTVVIGDMLFSLPIQVEGREDHEEAEGQMEVDDGGNDSAHGNGNPTEPKGTNDSSRENNNQASGLGQKKYSASGGKKRSGASKEQDAETNQDQKEMDELICDAGQQEMLPHILGKEVQVHVQHNLLPQSGESKQVVDKSQDDFKAEQVEHKNMARNVHEIKLQDKGSHDKVSGAKLLAQCSKMCPMQVLKTGEKPRWDLIWTKQNKARSWRLVGLLLSREAKGGKARWMKT